MYEIDLEKAKAEAKRLLQTALDGEEIVITEDDKPVLRLVPVNGVRRFAGSGFLGDVIPGLTLAALAHPGLNSAAATRLINANIRVDSWLSWRYLTSQSSMARSPAGRR